MTIFYNASDFEVKEFYHYPTTVCHRLAEWDEGFHKGAPDLNEDIKDLFEELLKETEKKLGKSLMDNKIAMKVVHKPSNTEYFIGYKDWNWSVGLVLNPYMIGKMEIIK